MNFCPNHKTLEYIYAVCENKTICSSDFKSAELIFLNTRLQKTLIGKYTINDELFEFDRNVVIYLSALRNIISLDTPYSKKTMVIYKEIVSILDTIETSFNIIKKAPNDIFIIKPTEFFTRLLKIKQHDNKSAIFVIYKDLAKEYLNQLEHMAYTIINRIDELDFDLRGYTEEFFNEFSHS